MTAPAIDASATLAADAFDLVAATQRAAAAERAVFVEAFRPRARMNLLEWSESRRYLSPEANAIAADAGCPVRYSSALTPYHREPMLALSDQRTEYVVCEFPSQDGKTEILNNFFGWRIDIEPGPMLVLQPTGQMAEAWSKDRLAPMLRDTPALRGKVRDARSRDADNTILHKKFPGGHLTAVGSNSAAGLASRPIRDVGADEVDRCAKSAGTEGDSLRLAFRRTATFRRGKKLLISSPTIKDESRIDAEYLLGTQEEWHVPCPHCGEFQYLAFGGKKVAWGIKWESVVPPSQPGEDVGNGGAKPIADPTTAYYVCQANGCVIEEHQKASMIAAGKWVMHNPAAYPRRRSFKKTAWASNLVAWRKLVAEWLEIVESGDPMQIQQFINTVNTELWDPLNGKEIKLEGLVNRLGEGYPEDNEVETGTLPEGVLALTASVDTQDDRLERAVWGWGIGEEAWLIDWSLIPGDPGTPAPWRELDELRARTYKRADGTTLKPRVTFIDSGGHHSKEVYAYCRSRQSRGVFAIKGSSLEGAPLLGRPTRNNSARTILYPVGSFTGKDSLATRLAKIEASGPGYIHLPAWLDSEQVAQFTRSRLITPTQRGGRKWTKRKRAWEETGRVEQFHLYVYALAALQKLGPHALRDLAKRAAAKATSRNASSDELAPPPVASDQPRRARSSRRTGLPGGINGWKR